MVELLRGNRATANLPIIYVIAIFSDEYHHRKVYDAGAVDFLSKPFNPEILRSKVRVFLQLDASKTEVIRQNATLADLVARLEQQIDVVTKLLANRVPCSASRSMFGVL